MTMPYNFRLSFNIDSERDFKLKSKKTDVIFLDELSLKVIEAKSKFDNSCDLDVKFNYLIARFNFIIFETILYAEKESENYAGYFHPYPGIDEKLKKYRKEINRSLEKMNYILKNILKVKNQVDLKEWNSKFRYEQFEFQILFARFTREKFCLEGKTI